ncbi:MAG: DUF2779 domain-containing protein [Candidatus Dadabacteria bacterium]
MNTIPLPPKHILSKSTFMRGCQCPKSLWLHKHHPELKDEMTEQQARIFAQGTSVGALARDLFPGGVDASPDTPYDYQQSVVQTAAYIAEGQTIIYEAAFQYNGVLAALDILVKHRGRWIGYEVKSSTSVKEPFIQDAALQYYVITNAGIELHDLYIVYINNQYVRNGDLQLDQLFTRASLKKEVVEQQPFIAQQVEELKNICALSCMPATTPGPHCDKPYTCDFYGHCWKDLQENYVIEKECINKPELRKFIDRLEYPLYFMDFETYMLPVPEYDGHWPYRQVPFQFSVHRQACPNAPLEHLEYLAPTPGVEDSRQLKNDDLKESEIPNSKFQIQNFQSQIPPDPCKEFIEKLLAVIGDTGSIIVYNQTFELTRLRELKEDYPAFASRISNLESRIIDLMVPFRCKHLYLPAMNGSYSIKAVLPALVPEMSYEDLDINNGGDAGPAFYNLRNETDEQKISETREALLNYCGMDTMAMVKVLKIIQEMSGKR